MRKITIALLALMTVLNQAFSQSEIEPEECNISKLLIQYDNTTCNGYLVVDASKHFYCYPEPIDSFMDVTDLYTGTILPYYNDNDSLCHVFLTDPPLFKSVRFNEDKSQNLTVKNSFSKDIPNFKDSKDEFGHSITTMPKRITIENAYLQSKFGYDKGDAIVRLIIPDNSVEYNKAFYCIDIFMQTDKKFTMTSSYGCVDYPQGFVVKNIRTYKHLGRHNKELMSAIRLCNRKSYKKDSIWINSGYPYYVEIENHKFLISNDVKDNKNAPLLNLCEKVRLINKHKRYFWKPKLPFK